MTSYRYQVGGSLNYQDASYVNREADCTLYEALQQGEFCYVFNSRQMGKSSLLVKTKHRLEEAGFYCIAIDLTGIGSENINVEQWYKGLIYQLYLGSNFAQKINIKRWWSEQQDISLVQRLNNFIIEIFLPELNGSNLIIFIDEIDSIFKLPFSSDDFFAFIRFCYNQRAINSQYQRITFALFGVATPSQLISDRQKTPFNIGRAIELTGFSLEQAQLLTEGLNCNPEISKLILKDILVWTEGQPFLTQKICYLISQALPFKNNNNININNLVNNSIQDNIINNWEHQDKPEHLLTISDRLLNNETIILRLLGIYQEILLDRQVTRDNSIEQRELMLSGLLVVDDRGVLKVKNLIYQKIFNLAWVEKHLSYLRPYSKQIKAWIASKQQDNSYLLKNSSLDEALQWSRNKRLANIDYQFIAASQALAKQQIEYDLDREKQVREKVEIALEAANQAHHILAQSKVSARRKTNSFRLSLSWLMGIILSLSSCIIMFRSTGSLQAIELGIFDYLTQITSPSIIDSPITVINIEESDLQNIKQYPLSDRVLARAINNLIRQQPRVIGLDIYRDLPVEPGYKELREIFKNTPNLIGVEKKVGSKVNPPQVLAELQQVGFNDLILDGDAEVRRALLSYQVNSEKVQYSFALQLALKYLDKEGITQGLLI